MPMENKLYLLVLIFIQITIVKNQAVVKKQANIQQVIQIQTDAIPQSGNQISFNSLWSINSQTFRRPNATRSGNFYYQAVLITVQTTGVYSIRSLSFVNTFGYLYSPAFNQRSPNQDLIARDDNSGGSQQFQLNRTLTVNRRYYLIITTFFPLVTGSFSIIISGPTTANVFPITSPFSFDKTINSALIFNNPLFRRPNGYSSEYFYSVFEITVQTTGDYMFQSTSNFDSYGCLYYPTFNKASPSSNLLTYDDDAGNFANFYIAYRLVADRRYFLVATTFSTNVLGTFAINATGPGPFDMVEITERISLVNTTISSALTKQDQKFRPPHSFLPNYHYKLFQIVPSRSQYFIFQSFSRINVFTYLYQDSFSPLNPFSYYASYPEFATLSMRSSLVSYLSTQSKYYLVVTSSKENVTGSFNVTIGGLEAVQSINIPTSQSATTTSSSSLTLNSTRFSRYYGDGDDYYYYQVFRLTVPTTGLYRMFTTGYLDTFGYLYRESFDPMNPYSNIIAYDDQSGGKNQFQLVTLLLRSETYFLVVTTYRGYTFGAFDIIIKGPGRASLVIR